MWRFLVNEGYSVNPTRYHFLRETALLFPGEGAVNVVEKPNKENTLKTENVLLGNFSPKLWDFTFNLHLKSQVRPKYFYLAAFVQKRHLWLLTALPPGVCICGHGGLFYRKHFNQEHQSKGHFHLAFSIYNHYNTGIFQSVVLECC